MHRNTYLVVSILAVLAALVVGVNVGRKISSPNTNPVPTPTIASSPPTQPQPQTFTDSPCGFSVQYTNDFTLTENASGSAVLQNAGDKNKSIIMTCQRNIPRPALPAENIESLSIPTTGGATVSAKLYHDQSSQDGTPIDAVIFTHPTSKLDIFIAGYGDAFNSLIKTITITP